MVDECGNAASRGIHAKRGAKFGAKFGFRLGTVSALGAMLALCVGLSGCGLAAAPCRVASAGLKIVPVVGHVAAAPTDACAGVIDP